MAEVLVGQAYYQRFDPKLWAAHQPYPPLGALYAAAVLRSSGRTVAFFDAMLAESENEWAESLDRHHPRWAVIYEDSFNYLSKMCLLRMREAALKMIDMARARSCPVVVSGSDATDHPDIYLNGGAAAAIAGEGEQTLKELIDTLAEGKPIHDVRGISVADADGQPRRSPPRELIRNLDGLPFPAWDLVEIDRYRRIWVEKHGYHSMNMVTTRGCPYHCNWCAKPIYGQRYAVRSPENVVEELARLRSEFAPDHISFADDVFGLKPGWVERYADLVTSRNIAIPFKCLSRADLLLGDPVVAALKRARCRTVWIGAESGSQKILDAMEKGITVDQIRAAARRLHDAGIEVCFFLQFGYPAETRDDIEMTIQMVRDCRPDDIGISVSYPLPGTPFYDRVREQLGSKRNWTDSDDLAMMYSGPFKTDFYRRLHRVVHKEFRARRLRGRLSGGGWSRLRNGGALLYNLGTLPYERLRLSILSRPSRVPVALPKPRLAREAAALPSQQPATGAGREQTS